MGLEALISGFKDEIDVIDTIGVYRTSANEFLYQDPGFGSETLILNLLDKQKLEKLTRLQLHSADRRVFLKRIDKIVVMIFLKSMVDVNQVLLELNVNKLIHDLGENR